MGNTYKVVESGTIQCACGGKVTLKSTVTGLTIGGKKPLYWKDILNAPVACPRSPIQNPCTKVVAISGAGTETNVGAKGEPYLLRTDGFKTDKGRAVILVDPGQSSSKIMAPPSTSSEEIKEDEPNEVAVKEEKEKLHKEKYALYFLRKSQDNYKPLRPSRMFRGTKDLIANVKDVVEVESVYTHTLAYVYIFQKGQDYKEYKIFSRGTLYSETIKDIYFQNTKTLILRNEIPLENDSSVEIYYSNLQIIDESEIKTLKKFTVNPKAPSNKNFFIKDIDAINKLDINEDNLTTQKKYIPRKDGKQTRKNIVVCIEDIIGEIEDMYERYRTNYNLAYARNHEIINKIKEQNMYSYTVANMVDYFYIDEKEQKTYDTQVKDLKDTYHKLVRFLLSDLKLVSFLTKDLDISKILEQDKKDIAGSYFQKLISINTKFFQSRIKVENTKNYRKTFVTTNEYFSTITGSNYKTPSYIMDSYKNQTINISINVNDLQFNSSDDKYTLIKDNALETLAYLTFAMYFSEEFEDIIKQSTSYKDIKALRNDFILKIKTFKPFPNIGKKDNKRDIKAVLLKQPAYKSMINKTDPFLDEFEDLDHELKINSYNYLAKAIKYKSLYSKDEKYYVVPEKEKPSEIMIKISSKLKENDLKEVLDTYSKIQNTNKKDYVISAMNIIYMLCNCRTKLDEEAKQNSMFEDGMDNIYKFYIDLTNKRVTLEEKYKEDIALHYGISLAYSKMQLEILQKNIIFNENKLSVRYKKTINFLKKYNLGKTKIGANSTEKDTKDYINFFDKEIGLTSEERAMFETIKTIEGIGSNIDKILEEYQKTDITQDKRISPHTITHIRTALGNVSSIMALANMVDYLFFTDNKDIKSHIGFSNDVISVGSTLFAIISKNPKEVDKVVQNLSLHKDLVNKNIKNMKSMTNLSKTVKYSIIGILITNTYDVVNLIKKEDYDAAIVTSVIAALTIAFLVIPFGLAGTIIAVCINIVWMFLSHRVLNSDIEDYLESSLFYQKNTRALITYKGKAVFGDKINKPFPSKYLIETLKNNVDLSQKADNGFNSVKALKTFIGEHYEKNKPYFTAALKTEMSFLKSALYGYKIELLGKLKNTKEVNNKYGRGLKILEDTYVKIPKILVEDKTSKFILNTNSSYIILDKDNINLFIKEKDYYIFNLNNNDFSDIKDLRELKEMNGISSSIIVLSSFIELKYKFKFLHQNINHLYAENFNQVGFTNTDINELKKLITEEEK